MYLSNIRWSGALLTCVLAIMASLPGSPAQAGERLSYSYDSRGRLVQVKRCGTINRGVQSSYAYDPADNRSNVTVSGVGGGGACNAADGSDFNGDGIDDILWRNDNGTVANWLGTANGSFVANDGNFLVAIDASWSIAGSGDFNGDGRDDILWRNANGNVTNWLCGGAGGCVSNDANALRISITSWKIAGIGDFNNDGRSDLLWRTDTGAITSWYGTATGGFSVGTLTSAAVASSWHVRGTGDINGDGLSDIVWRNDNGDFADWLGKVDGSFLENGAASGQNVSMTWTIIGVADFNGDGRSDVLWRNSNGDVLYWPGRTDGGFVTAGSSAYNVPMSWSVVGTGDYNGDGRADLLWRNSNGTLADWLSQPDGSFLVNDGAFLVVVSNDWRVQRLVTF